MEFTRKDLNTKSLVDRISEVNISNQNNESSIDYRQNGHISCTGVGLFRQTMLLLPPSREPKDFLSNETKHDN